MNKVTWYLNKGFDQKTAEYFASGRRKILSVVPRDDYKLLIKFDNEENRIFDVNPLIVPNTIFYFLSDIKNFKRVYLDDNACVSWDIDPNVDSNEVWNNKVDLSSDTCYLDSMPI